MLWLAILLPALPLQVFTRGVREAPPLAILSPRGRVLAASAAASAAGIEAGQRAASALALLPELRLQPREPAREAEALAEIATWAGRFSPRISLSAPDAVLLEISSCLRLFGGVTQIEAAVREGLGGLGFAARLGCAPTALAARWMARTGAPAEGAAPSRPIPPSFPSAPTAPSNAPIHTPCSTDATHADARDWRAALDPLPIELLSEEDACDAATLELLAGLGLRTLGELRCLPPAGLARRGAQAAARTIARARGELADPRPWFEAPLRFHHKLALPAPELHVEALLFAARRLFASLAAWLDARHAAIDRFCLRFGHGSRAPTEIEFALGRPSRDEARFALIVRERLAVLELSAEVDSITLGAERPLPADPRGTDLFGDPAQAGDAAALLLARLQARLGENGVQRLDLRADHRPEAAWRNARPSAPAVPPRARRDAPPGAPSTRTPPPPASTAARLRPLWLLPAPHPIAAPRYTLLGAAERIETGWWDGMPVRRDYYLARDADNVLCWIFESLDAPGQWFVHGYFG